MFLGRRFGIRDLSERGGVMGRFRVCVFRCGYSSVEFWDSIVWDVEVIVVVVGRVESRACGEGVWFLFFM